jgi:hypothetical protein
MTNKKQADIYAETLNKDKKYIPNTSYSNFRKMISKITRKKLICKYLKQPDWKNKRR